MSNMEIYMLDMTKRRWEIRVYDMTLMMNSCYITELKRGGIVRYNERFCLGTNKKELLEYANDIINIRLSNLNKEVEYYKSMKVKVTRK